MNSKENPTTSTPTSRMLKSMVGIGVFCALAIVLVYQITLPIIDENKDNALTSAIFQLFPEVNSIHPYGLTDNQDLVVITPDVEGAEEMQKIYVGYGDSKELVGVAIEASGQGYADIIRIIYGYQIHNNRVIGFNVLESKETPGLGDKIEKDQHFQDNFSSLVLPMSENNEIEHRIVPVKNGNKKNDWEVEGITGATISSRAIGNMLGKSTALWGPILARNEEKLKQYSK